MTANNITENTSYSKIAQLLLTLSLSSFFDLLVPTRNAVQGSTVQTRAFMRTAFS